MSDTTDPKEQKQEEEALSEEDMDKVAGGAKRSATGPGTQTEDDVYVGIK